MKKTALSIVIAVVLILSVVGGTALAALPGGGWVTNVQVQNVGAAQATVLITSYAGGNSYPSPAKPVAIGGSATFLNTELGLPSGGFQGAGVVSSDQPIFGILFATNYQANTANTASAIVQAVSSEKTANNLAFPLVKKNWGGAHKTTTLYIQNAGSANTNVTVTMAPLSGSCNNNPRTYNDVRPSEQINFTPADLGCAGPMYGSASITSSGQPLAGIVLEADDSTAAPAGGTRVVQGTTGFATSGANPDYDTVLIAPIIKKGWGANDNVTGLQVQNVSGATIAAGNLRITYTIVGADAGNGMTVGGTVLETNAAQIPVGAAYNSLHPGLANGTLASAVIEVLGGGSQIVGIVNENRPLGSPVFRNTTYSMLPEHAGATSVSLPLVKEYFGGQGGRCTGVQVVAVGGNAQMQLTYKSGADTYTVTTTGAVGTKTFLRLSDAGVTSGITGNSAAMRGKNFGVTATSLTPGVTLVAVANESFCPGAPRDEDDANYEGFPMVSPT